MKRILSVLLLATLLFTTVACLTSCEEDNGAEISVFLSERIYDFDPAGSYYDDATIAVLHLIYEPLFVLNEKGDVKKAMADDYEFEDNGDLVIELRESYWTSGKRVTASDFVWAWKRIINCENSFDCAPLLYDIKNARYIKSASVPEGVTGASSELGDFGAIAEDIDTLRIKFESKDVDRDAFLRNLTSISLSPVNRESLNNGQDTYWNLTDNMTGYCNGPFRIKELNTADGYFTLARNDVYHRPADSGKSADHYVLPAAIRTIWDVTLDYDTGAKDETYLSELYKELGKKADATVFYMSALSLEDRKAAKEDAVVSDTLSTYSYVFDTTNPLFADAKVRRVLSSVIDRNEIVKIVTFGKAATGFISNGVWDSTSDRENKSFRAQGDTLISLTPMSIETAQSELAGVTKGAFTLYCENREEDIAIANYVAGRWTQLGYSVTVDVCTAYKIEEYVEADPGAKPDKEEKPTIYYGSELNRRYRERDFDVIAIDYQMFSTNALTALASLSNDYCGSGIDLEAYNKSEAADKKLEDFRLGNAAGYSSDVYDEYIKSAMNTCDLKDRAAILHKAEKQLMDDMPIIPLLFNQNFYVKHKYLKKLDVNYYGFTVFTEAKLRNYDKYTFDMMEEKLEDQE